MLSIKKQEQNENFLKNGGSAERPSSYLKIITLVKSSSAQTNGL